MTELTKIIEQDDLETFKTHFNIENWTDSITQIENYAGVSKYTPNVSYNECDCLKYALHVNADKIFNYLLPKLSTEKHGENYGWPLLAMALKNNRYDYANQIIQHSSFNPYHMYHTNCFTHIDTRDNAKEHIEFLFNYLDIFARWDFSNHHLIHTFTELICYSEDTFNRFNQVYQEKVKKENGCVLDIFHDHMDILAKEVLYRSFNTRILDKLNSQQFKSLIESIMDDKIIFMPLFESANAVEGVNYLLKEPELLQKYINQNQVILSYLPLEGVVLLIENNIDFFVEGEKNRSPIDYMLDYSNIEEPITSYLINLFTQKIYERCEKEGRESNVQKFCQQKLFDEKLTEKTKNSVKKSKL